MNDKVNKETKATGSPSVVVEDVVRDKVRQELRRKKVKLWLSPYFVDQTPNNKESSAMRLLACQFSKDLKMEEDSVLLALKDLQNHALSKLQSKKEQQPKDKNCAKAGVKNVTIKVLLGFSLQQEQQSKLEVSFQDLPANWAEKITLENNKSNNNALMINLQNMSHSLTHTQLQQEFQTRLQRVIYNNNNKSFRLRLIFNGQVLGEGNDNDQSLSSLLAMQQSSSQDVTLLCLVSPGDLVVVAGNNNGSFNNQQETSSNGNSMDKTTHMIRAIRNAASGVASSSMLGRLEITDQHGRNVGMSPQERLAFCLALGFHHLGRRCQRQQEQQQGNNNQSNNNNNSNQENIDALSSSLVYLLEADKEWNQIASSSSFSWKDRVDNYGLLQLDIAWVYLELACLDHLPDAKRRLDIAEQVLRRQVHSNFITLALVQADMGRPVPALAAIFVRLFLLQGVAAKFSNDNATATTCLDQAYSFCASLRAVSPIEVVQTVCDTSFVSPSVAISALRRSNGCPNAATDLIQTESRHEVEAHQNRRRQRRLGLCDNGRDFVNLDLVSQLQSLLFGANNNNNNNNATTNDSQLDLAVCLLRLGNNDLERCIDLHQQEHASPGMISQRLEELNQRQRRQGLWTGPKQQRQQQRRRRPGVVVDQVALTTLISMGITESNARKALEKCNNHVEMAILELTRQQDAANHEGEHQSNNEGEDDDDDEDDEDYEDDGDDDDEDEDMMSMDDMDEDDEDDIMDFADENGNLETMRFTNEDAQHLLEHLLEQALQGGEDDGNNTSNVANDYLGNRLDREWELILKYRGQT